MRRIVGVLATLLAAVFAAAAPSAAAEKTINIVAAENFYGDIAAQLGGRHVNVVSILNNPDQDPHLFEASASTARALAAAQIVIYNGADYDPWVDKLLSASKRSRWKPLVVADLIERKSGDNPHLWYLPRAMAALAKALSANLTGLDPANRDEYVGRLQLFDLSLAALEHKIGAMRERFKGTPVTATEPVFGYMAAALGLAMRNARFQLSLMNGTEPGTSDVAAFEDDLRTRRVKVLIYNSQTSDAATERLKSIATRSGVPIVGVSETEPAGKTYQEWMTDQLRTLEEALSGGVS